MKKGNNTGAVALQIGLPLAFFAVGGLLFMGLTTPLADTVESAPLAYAMTGYGPIDVSMPEPEPEPEPEEEPEPEPPKFVNINEYGYPSYNDLIGRIYIEGTNVDCDIYYGDTETQMSRGAGMHAGDVAPTTVPGEDGTVLVPAHTGTYFRDFENLELGMEVTIEAYWGTYVYEIVDMYVAEATDETAYDLYRQDENIILYTCWPFGDLSPGPYRYFVFGEYVSGPMFTDGEVE